MNESYDAQLFLYIRSQGENNLENFLMCRALQITTRNKDIFLRPTHLLKEGLEWINSSACNDSSHARSPQRSYWSGEKNGSCK